MMNETKNKKIVFIINPQSGSNQNTNLEPEISRMAKEYQFKWNIFYTEGNDDISKIDREIKKHKPGIVVTVGGDGTVNMVASLLINSKIKLGIVPAGSANGLGYNLGIPTNFDEAIHHIFRTKAKPTDVIRINQKHYCLHLSDIGINARIVKRFEKEGSKGLTGYGKQLLKELFSKASSFSFYLETPLYKKKSKAEMIVIANARSFGTGAVINPDGKPDDGRFEIIIIKPYPWWFLFYFILMFLTGRMYKMQYIKLISATKASIQLFTPHDLQIDGEIFEGIRKLDIRILPGALNIFYE
jgi:diacylglycerol kinase (ATP)